jgi:hypothetical protein
MIRHLIIAAALAAAPLHAEIVQTNWSAELWVDGSPGKDNEGRKIPVLYATTPAGIRAAASSFCAFVPKHLNGPCLLAISEKSFRSITTDGPSYHPYIIGLEKDLAGGWKTYIPIYGQQAGGR